MNGVILRRTTDKYNQMDMPKAVNNLISFARNKGLPVIPINSKDVHILRDPKSFYDNVRSQIRAAKSRISLGALYLGTGPKEIDIVNDLHLQLGSNANLKVDIYLDHNRGQRVDHNNQSSVSLLNRLATFEKFDLHLIETFTGSILTKLLLKKFNRLGEIVSTFHSKFLVSDHDTIITGANLSQIYFEKRQDRYMLLKDSKLLSDYLIGVMKEISRADISVHDAVRRYNRIFHENNTELKHGLRTGDNYTCIIPLVQLRKSGLTDCDDFLDYINKLLPDKAQVYLSSGYFNPHTDMRFNSIIAPSEQANGFYQGSSLLKFVPGLYTSILSRYESANPMCDIRLYQKPSWSYHAKGIWIEDLEDAYIQFIGSSNYNWRSSTRDLETQFVIITSDKDLIQKLRSERMGLWQDSVQIKISPTNTILEIMSKLLKSFL